MIKHVCSRDRGDGSGDVLDPISLAYDLGDSYTEPLVDHDYLAFAQQLVVDKNFNRFASCLVEFDYRALSKLQHLVNDHAGSSQFNGDFKRDIQQKVKVLVASWGCGCGIAKFSKGRGLNPPGTFMFAQSGSPVISGSFCFAI